MERCRAQITRSALAVRTYRPTDADAVCRLACHGALFDVASPDTAVPLGAAALQLYQANPRSHFWVAEAGGGCERAAGGTSGGTSGDASGDASGGASGGGEVVGTMAVVQEQERVARLRHLRVAPAWQDTPVARRLVEAVAEHCRRHGYLKLVLDAPLDPDHAIDLLGQCGLRYTRCRCDGRHPMLEFYVDLYHRSGHEPAAGRVGGGAALSLRRSLHGRAPAAA